MDTLLHDYLTAMGYRLVILPTAWYTIRNDINIRGGGHRAPMTPEQYMELAVDSALDDIESRYEYGRTGNP